jgi:mono/diheme cytochrome c family protein
MTLAAQNKVAPSSMSAGKAVYEQYCITCHQVDGVGAQNMIPPLIKTSYVLGDKTTFIKIILNGMSGEIKVNGEMYSNEMPSQAFLQDEDIASVITYVRNSFGNKASAVTADEVKKTRAANKK